MADDVKERLRGAPSAMMVSPYFNVADKHYVSSADLRATLDHIASLEAKIAALELYLDGPPKIARCGVPITKARSEAIRGRE